MNLKDLLMDGDDAADLSDAELMEQRRRQYEGLKSVMEERRALLESKGMDVDGALAELAATWAEYEKSVHEVEEKEEAYLQSTANVADARENLLRHLRDGVAAWKVDLELAPAGSTQRVEVWEGFTAWKAEMRTAAEASLAADNDPNKQEAFREALRILED
ncbi:MAG: hypothetical protein H7A55_15950 [Verrucomicrobiaceae bacterium]|nr:hypothetical protein [Verrucomicrobiaceae bacterium]